jgi:ABC-type nitrate/sulfonate/bicarbonate transport system ATPase subunit
VRVHAGCGKTTLLNALSGRLASTATLDGTVMVNGHKTRLSYGKSAYVTQDEMLIAMLTARR